MDIQVLNAKGEEVRKAALPASVAEAAPVPSFLHEIVVYYQANRRRGTADCKTRAEVSGGGKKPWKQKHTGRARAGSNRSPLWRKGGVAFGPHPRSYRQGLPDAKRRLALAQSLNAVGAQGGLVMLDAVPVVLKTKELSAIVRAVAAGRALLVLDKVTSELARAGRNIPGLTLSPASDLNAYEVLKNRRVILTEPALKALGEMLR